MSRKVKERLMLMRILQKTNHEDRVELDKKIEEKTGKYCDLGVYNLSDEELLEILNQIWKKKKKKKLMEVAIV